VRAALARSNVSCILKLRGSGVSAKIGSQE